MEHSTRKFGIADALMVHALEEVNYELDTIIDGVDPCGEYAWDKISFKS